MEITVDNAVDDKNDQAPPNDEKYVVTEAPKPGVVVEQPSSVQGVWVKPDLCGLCCDSTCCYASL